jgi:rRNA-processing protein FCF1
MDQYVDDLVQRYRSRGVLIDTNILLLFFVGCFDRWLITRFKRTVNYSVEDYDILTRFVGRFDRMVTTPNILAEVNSLSGQMAEPTRTNYLRHFSKGIGLIAEEYVVSADAARLNCFPKIGLTDSGIMHLVRGNYLVLTDDSGLHGFLAKEGIDALNFNHLRPY